MIEGADEAREYFGKYGYAVVDNFLDPDALAVYSNYVLDNMQGGHWEFGDPQVNTRFFIHNEPMVRYLHEAVTEKVAAVAGCELLPTYVYTIGYMKGSLLPRHTDRPACEISATVTLYGDGDAYPIYLNSPKMEDSEKQDVPCVAHEMGSYPATYNMEKDIDHSLQQVSDHPLASFPNPIRGQAVPLNPGDALIYEGQNIDHWRNELEDDRGFISLLFHYVKKDGLHRIEYMNEGNQGWLKENNLFVPRVLSYDEVRREREEGASTASWNQQQDKRSYNAQDQEVLNELKVTDEREKKEIP